jgi:hypothetical protein
MACVCFPDVFGGIEIRLPSEIDVHSPGLQLIVAFRAKAAEKESGNALGNCNVLALLMKFLKGESKEFTTRQKGTKSKLSLGISYCLCVLVNISFPKPLIITQDYDNCQPGEEHG